MIDSSYNTQELNYNMILINHIDRMSNALTMSEPELRDKFRDIVKDAGEGKENSIIWAVEFFIAILPDSLQDDVFKESMKNVFKKAKEDAEKHNYKQYMPSWYPLHKLNAIINLLDRKGLLLSRKLSGFKRPKINIGEEFEE